MLSLCNLRLNRVFWFFPVVVGILEAIVYYRLLLYQLVRKQASDIAL